MQKLVGALPFPHLLIPVGVGCGNDPGRVSLLLSLWLKGLWQVYT